MLRSIWKVGAQMGNGITYPTSHRKKKKNHNHCTRAIYVCHSFTFWC